METVLDRFGRVVVPKEAREMLGLQPGARLEVIVTEDSILLRPPDAGQPLRVSDGVLVYAGSVVGDLSSVVSEHRNQRIAGVTRGKRK